MGKDTGKSGMEETSPTTDHQKALPLLALDAQVLPNRGSTFCVPMLSCLSALDRLCESGGNRWGFGLGGRRF